MTATTLFLPQNVEVKDLSGSLTITKTPKLRGSLIFSYTRQIINLFYDVEVSIVSDTEFANRPRVEGAALGERAFGAAGEAAADLSADATAWFTKGIVPASTLRTPPALWLRPTSRAATEGDGGEVVTRSIPAGRDSMGVSASRRGPGPSTSHSPD
ncbi:hypothetical protein EYR40_007965 [Pleurotus pulmonarius]|nr:hypothetical protein EYR40_007965 [Pleurotus pulmonarius]